MNYKNWKLLTGAGLPLLLFLFWIFFPSGKEETNLLAIVKRGEFISSVFTTGELEAKSSVNILGPSGIQRIGIWQFKISDLIAEGTVVEKGDFIGSLDQTEIMNKIKDEENELIKIQSKFIQTKLDTTLELRQARDELSNLEFTVMEKQIVVEQSKFEPPASIRQVNLDLERTIRSKEQLEQNYKLKVSQAQAKMQEITASLNQAERKLELMKNILEQFTIMAPEAGMVIYHRDWNGKKKIVGSTVSAWEPIVATLPDLSVMLSKTFVNEVDIRRVKLDQEVNISLDAYPEKKLTGKVISVANVGEQNIKTDAKVFEVNILVNEKDTTLRPAMTTGNHIIADRIEVALYIPLEAIFNQGDSISFVHKKETIGFVRQEIKTGAVNDNYAVVLEGLKEKEMVSLAAPKEGEKIKLILLKK
jgi:HlyD family secretion protein